MARPEMSSNVWDSIPGLRCHPLHVHAGALIKDTKLMKYSGRWQNYCRKSAGRGAARPNRESGGSPEQYPLLYVL